jgi:hypothetical protein
MPSSFHSIAAGCRSCPAPRRCWLRTGRASAAHRARPRGRTGRARLRPRSVRRPPPERRRLATSSPPGSSRVAPRSPCRPRRPSRHRALLAGAHHRPAAAGTSARRPSPARTARRRRLAAWPATPHLRTPTTRRRLGRPPRSSAKPSQPERARPSTSASRRPYAVGEARRTGTSRRSPSPPGSWR